MKFIESSKYTNRKLLFISLSLGFLTIPLSYLLDLISSFLDSNTMVQNLWFFIPVAVSLYFLIIIIVPAILAFILTRSWELTTVSIGSAVFVFLLTSATSSFFTRQQIVKRGLQEMQQWEQFQQSVKIEKASYEFLSPLSKNIYPQYGQMYEKVNISIELVVKEKDRYKISIDFRGTNSGQKDHQEQELFLNPGVNQVEFVLESSNLPGYWFQGNSTSTIEVSVMRRMSGQDIFPNWEFTDEPAIRYWSVTSKKIKLKNLSTVPLR